MEVNYVGKFLRLCERNTWEFADRLNCSGVVGIMALTHDSIVLVEEYREPVEKSVIGIPAGLVGDIQGEEDEAFETAAKRELLEETGYDAGNMIHIGDFPLSPGFSTEIMSIFKATNLTKVREKVGDGTENIIVHELPVFKAHRELETLAKGKMIDLKVFMALYFAGLEMTSRLIKGQLKLS